VGKRCLFVAGVAIAGNCTLGDDVVLYGQVGIAQNLRIGNKVTVYAQSGVGIDLEEGKTYLGTPAAEARSMMRQIFALKQLPDVLLKWRQKG
jgi:UDP-3-O-[3-hydroxymyristoyl] glucosamine N-acyltransferase